MLLSGWSVICGCLCSVGRFISIFLGLEWQSSVDWRKYYDKHMDAADAAEALEGEELDAAVRENADAQAYKEDPSFKVVAQVVDQEPAAELANGDADLSTTGQHECAQAEPTLLA